MDFVKKHYEKIILVAVLLGLVGFLIVLPFIIAQDHEETDQIATTIISTSAKPLPDLELARMTNATARLDSPPAFDFTTTNKLFNSMEWKKTPEGGMFKVKTSSEVVQGCVVTKITPLYFILSLDSVETNGIAPRYVIGIERQAEPYPAMRRKQERYASLDDPKKDAFTLLQVKGPQENPAQLILKLADTGETVTIAPGKPFERVDAYSADLKYDPEKRNFPGRRVGSMLSFGGEDYLIVAIDPNEVIVSAQSNQKKTALKLAP
ncbi:MAG TPA: hypothetical protein VIK59_07415 [Verrucomicrobiae bacterium]